MSDRSVLILAELDDDERAAIESDCVRAGFKTTWTSSVEVASGHLSTSAFDGLLLDLATPGAARLCIKARGKLAKGRFPIVALSATLDDNAFERAFRAGADDVVALSDRNALSNRLGTLPRRSLFPPDRPRGEALIADPDRARADLLERVLIDAGYRVEVIRDELAAKLHLGRPHVRLVVLDPSLGNLASLFEQSRKKGARSVWVVRARPEKLAEIARAFQPDDPVSAISAFGPPDDVLFEANRLLDESQTDARADPRILYSTMVTFSPNAGAAEDHGYSYNISPSGLYVRTLAPPATSDVEVRLRAPISRAPLTFRGSVVWRRIFGPTQQQSAPPGFGVKLVGGDLEEWVDAFRRYYDERHGIALAAHGAPGGGALRKPSRSEPLDAPPSSRRAAIGALKKTMVGIAPGPTKPPLPRREITKTSPGVAPPAEGSSGASESPAPPSSQTGDGEREMVSSVENLLTDALGAQNTETQTPGSIPLTITGGFGEAGSAAIVELEGGQTAATENGTAPHASSAPIEGDDLSRWSDPDFINPSSQTSEPAVPPAPPDLDEEEDDALPLARTIAVTPVPPPATSAPAPKNEAPPAPGPDAASVAEEEAVVAAKKEVRTADVDENSPAEVNALPISRKNQIGSWVAIAALVAGVVAGGFFALRERTSSPTPHAVVKDVTAAAPKNIEKTAPPTSDSAAAVAARQEDGVELAKGEDAVAPSAVPEVANPPASTAVRHVDEPAAEPTDIEIPPGMAGLYVASSMDANVYVHGKLVGRTNQSVVSHCGVRFVRLGNEPGDWLGEGAPTKIRCEVMNRIELP